MVRLVLCLLPTWVVLLTKQWDTDLQMEEDRNSLKLTEALKDFVQSRL